MGVTESTPANLVIGAGSVLRDSTDAGATKDANVFRVNRTYFTPELNGVKGQLLGTTYIQKSEGILEVSVPEISAEILATTWPGSVAAEQGGETTIDEDDTRRLPTEAYHDWELQVPGLTKVFGFQCDNALNLGSIEASAGDASEMAPKLELHSFWDPADLTKSPHRIVISPLGS
jgi:hypothetical protein